LTNWGYLSMTIIIISGLIAVITELFEFSEQRKESEEIKLKLKNGLLRDLHCPINSIANKAVHELRGLGKLTGEDSWTKFAKLGGNADLSNARLYDANFEGARLYGANLTKADLRNINFRNADLTGVNLYKSNMTNAKFDEKTVLPDGNQWNSEINLSKFINDSSWKEKQNWLEQIDFNEDFQNFADLLERDITAKNIILYLKHKYPNSEIEIAEDELHFRRHWITLKEFEYEQIKDIDSLLYRTEKARQWVWEDKEIPYLIVNISYSLALENPKLMNLTNWTNDTINKVHLAREKFFNLVSE